MALVTISGYPCSGKTARTKQIQAMLEARQSLPVLIINDESQNLSRQAYDSATSEKSARAALFSAVTRNMGPDRIVICDSLNYIKGYRYQLYCAARESRCRTCTIQVAAPAEQCKAWNRTEAGTRYTEATLDNLISRYEEPSPFVRWDSPLITIPWEDAEIPANAIYDAIFSSELKPPTAATVTAQTGSTDYLSTLESTASSVIKSLLTAQSASPGGGQTTFSVSLPNGTSTRAAIMLPQRAVGMPLLQRLKRQFVTLQKQTAGKQEWDQPKIAELFVGFLGDHLL